MSRSSIRKMLGVVVFSLTVSAAHAAPWPTPRDFTPDPASLQRCGPAYRFPQAGWIYLHIEGEPYERGYQYGKLLAPEIADYIKSLATYRSPKAPTEAWRDLRLLCDVLFLRRYDQEYLEEMKGIADGAAAAGAKFDGRAVDLRDVVTINSSIEIDFLDAAAEATPTGLEGKKFLEPPYAKPKKLPPSHCSAFAATGPATADGKIVFGHITMWNLYHVRHFNVWLDVKPSKGHRVLMQTFPGGIMSGMDYYLNDAGLLVAETTITQTKFDINGWSLVARIRKALQYADNIDKAVEILGKDNNGLYTNEWLLADIKTNEVAMYELGTHKSKLWLSSKNEWIGNTPGFYWGCNNTKDLQVRLETIPGVEDRPGNMVFHPTDRDMTWMRLYEKHKGKINADFGFEAFTTPPLAAYPSCDAKFTTTDLAKDLKTWALFGPPLGRTWEASPSEKEKYADIQPLVSNDWAVLSGKRPAEGPQSLAVDLGKVDGRTHKSTSDDEEDVEGLNPRSKLVITPAWHGTILPKTDADIWLASAFADYERIVALEKSLKANAKDGKLSEEEKDKLAVAQFAPRSTYLAAVRTWGQDKSLAETQNDYHRSEWYDIAAGKGVLLLAELREQMTAEKFDKMMDDFGRANAGKQVATDQFIEHAEKSHGKPLADFFKNWLHNNKAERLGNGQACFSVASFAKERDQTLIIYGTQQESAAQREAAERLQRQLLARWQNITVAIKADKEVSDADLKNHHLLLIGRPETNSITAKCASGLPVTFGTASFVLRGKTYANAASAVIAAGDNPLNNRYSVVLMAGLSAESTWRSVERLPDTSAEAVLLAAGEKPRALVVDGNGKQTKE